MSFIDVSIQARLNVREEENQLRGSDNGLRNKSLPLSEAANAKNRR